MPILRTPMHAPQPEFNGRQLERDITPHEGVEHGADEYVTDFESKQEILKLYGIDIVEKHHIHEINGTIEDPTIKYKMYTALVEELKNGSSYALEFMFGEKLLSKVELEKYGIRELKELAFTLLQASKGQQRNRDKNLFIDTGILTEDEALDTFYSSGK